MTHPAPYRHVFGWLASWGAVPWVVWWLQDVLSFRFPSLLWGLFAVPVALSVMLLGRRLDALRDARMGDLRTLETLVAGRSPFLRRTRAALWLASLSLLLVAAAGPQYGSRTQTVRRRGIDLVVALDFSKSMLARDVKPDRITRAKGELARFVAELTGDRVGVVAFAGDPIEFPMTTDYTAVELFLSDLGPYDMPVGGTDIGKALRASQQLLERADQNAPARAQAGRSQVVLLLTDGEDHEGTTAEAVEALSGAGIRLYAVGIGSGKPEPIPTYADDGTWTGYLRDEEGKPITTSLSPEGEAQLTALAESTGGKYFRARRGGVGITQIRAEIRRMKQKELEEQRITLMEDRYLLVLWPAFLLLLLEAWLPWGTRRGLSALLLATLAFGVTTPADAQGWNPFRRENDHVARGNRAYHRGDFAAAEERYRRAAEELPEDGAVQLNRGLAKLQQKDHEGAEAAFLEGIGSEAPTPVRGAAYYNLGVSRMQQAFAQEEAATAASPPTPERFRQAADGFRRAAETFRDALRQTPGNRDAAWNYELALREAREAEEKAAEAEAEQQAQEEQEEKSDASDSATSSSEEGEGATDPESQEEGSEDNTGESEGEDPSEEPGEGDDEGSGEQGPESDESRDAPSEAADQGNPSDPQDDNSSSSSEAAPEDRRPGEESGNREAAQAGGAERQPAQPGSPGDAETAPVDHATAHPDVAQILDALEQREKSLPVQRALERGGGVRRPTKDW